MEATDFLKREHGIVRQVLEEADLQISAMAGTGSMDAVKVAGILAFLGSFLDRCHQAKEDARLFPLVERTGIPDFEVPVAILRREHEEGRERVRLLSLELAQSAHGDSSSIAAILEGLRDYVALLRRHMTREEEVFFPIIEASLTPMDQEELMKEFLASDEAGIAGGDAAGLERGYPQITLH